MMGGNMARASAMARVRRCMATISARCVQVDNPYTGEVFAEVAMDAAADAHRKVDQAVKAQKEWRRVPLQERQTLCCKWLDVLAEHKDKIARDVTGQMGKPLEQARSEVDGTIARSRAMIQLSTDALRADVFPDTAGVFRQITHEPVGLVYIIAPWNYPLMTVANCLVPAVVAGNCVILKHSPRTPLCGDHFQRTFEDAGFPRGVVQASFVEHDVAAEVMQRPEIDFVSFTGSVRGGLEVNQVVSSRFIDVTLELGGNDAAYVAQDADLAVAAKTITDGACYNAGQSCCGIERVFVHESRYHEFLEMTKQHFEAYTIGDPMDAKTTLGPMALPPACETLNLHVEDAMAKGAHRLTGSGAITDSAGNGRFYSPTLLAGCTRSMQIMTEECFGPIVGVQQVDSDEEAIRMINDSKYGLTAAVFTTSKDRALHIGDKLSVGTVSMNQCDVLDPMLAWTGLRNSGKGVSLSKYGFRSLTKLKSWNFHT